MDMDVAQIQHGSRRKLLDAALRVIRTKGYTATRVEDICETASLTKGSFFHHFKSKEDLALAATEHWNTLTGELFANAPHRSLADPLDRLLAYIDFREALLQGELPEFTCLIGTMVQEIYATYPALREACERSISGHAETLEPDIAEAMRNRKVTGDWTARSLALYTQAVIQGSFIVAAQSIKHLRHYIEMLFRSESKRDLEPESLIQEVCHDNRDRETNTTHKRNRHRTVAGNHVQNRAG
jgi:TetR/AcrR family transcriptional repressor of nem operon